MMRLLLLSLILVSFVSASSELQVYAKLFPKILAYDYNLHNKLQDNSVSIGIVYDEHSLEEAKQLEQLIRTLNPEVNGFPLKTVLIDTATFTLSPPQVSALLLMGNPDDEAYYAAVRTFAVRKSIIVFALRMKDLERYATIGLFFGKSVRPIINKKLMIESNIRMKTTFLKFARVYDE